MMEDDNGDNNDGRTDDSVHKKEAYRRPSLQRIAGQQPENGTMERFSPVPNADADSRCLHTQLRVLSPARILFRRDSALVLGRLSRLRIDCR